MAREVRIGAHVLPHGSDYAQVRQAWLAAEEIGVDALFTTDHFLAPTTRPRDKNLECWMLLAAMAEVTSGPAIGSLVTGAAFRNPNLLADMARTVDCVSGGRVILGLGAGWFRPDFVEYGYEFGSAASRVAALERTLKAVKARLPKLSPPPVGQLPILIGGGGERVTLRLAAEHADIWHLRSVDPEALRSKGAVLDDWCRRAGRNPDAIERSCGTTPALDDPDALVDAGATFLMLTIEGPHYDMAPLREAVEWRDARRQTS